MDEDNFTLTVGKWHIVMAGGELEINDCSYQEDEADPTYDLVREILKLSKMGESK